MTTRAAVFGDVHGRLDLLQTLIGKIRERYGMDIDLYSTGDLIDRGPDSRGVIELCIQEGIEAVMGNHESWLHMYCMSGQFDAFALHRIMGGIATLASYGVTNLSTDAIERGLKARMPNRHMQFILELPLWQTFEVGGETFRLSHAGLKTSDAEGLLEHDPDLATPEAADLLMDLSRSLCHQSILWSGFGVKDPNVYAFADGSVQIFGHVPLWEPMIRPHFIGVDTGCGTRNPEKLSAVILPEREVITVDKASEKITGPGFNDFTL